MKNIIKILFLVSSILLLSVSVMAGNKEGFAKIVRIKGEVSIKRRGGDKSFKAAVGMRLVEGDSIYTQKDGNVTVVLDNNNQMTIGTDSVVNLAEMKKLSKNSAKTVVSVKKGSIFSNIKKKLTEKEIYQIKTPNAVAGVRGTKFYVNVQGNDSFVYVLEGKVRLESVVGKKSIYVKRGELAKAENNDNPFLIKNSMKENMIKVIKDKFINEFEQKNYKYGASGQRDRLILYEIENDYTASVDFDPSDPSGSDAGGNTYTVPTRRITVLYGNIPPSYKLNINSVNMSSNNPSISIDYDGVLMISGEIVPLPGTALSDTFTGKSLYLLHGGIPAARLIPLNVTDSGNKFLNIISTSDFDLSNEDSFEFWIN